MRSIEKIINIIKEAPSVVFLEEFKQKIAINLHIDINKIDSLTEFLYFLLEEEIKRRIKRDFWRKGDNINIRAEKRDYHFLVSEFGRSGVYIELSSKGLIPKEEKYELSKKEWIDE